MTLSTAQRRGFSETDESGKERREALSPLSLFPADSLLSTAAADLNLSFFFFFNPF